MQRQEIDKNTVATLSSLISGMLLGHFMIIAFHSNIEEVWLLSDDLQVLQTFVQHPGFSAF